MSTDKRKDFKCYRDNLRKQILCNKYLDLLIEVVINLYENQYTIINFTIET